MYQMNRLKSMSLNSTKQFKFIDNFNLTTNRRVWILQIQKITQSRFSKLVRSKAEVQFCLICVSVRVDVRCGAAYGLKKVPVR